MNTTPSMNTAASSYLITIACIFFLFIILYNIYSRHGTNTYSSLSKLENYQSRKNEISPDASQMVYLVHKTILKAETDVKNQRIKSLEDIIENKNKIIELLEKSTNDKNVPVTKSAD